MKDMPDAAAVMPPQPRDYHGVNWAGLRTLYLREIRRFWKVGMQTLAAPVVTALLYMMVFVVAAQGARTPVHGVAFATFVAPGLIMMQILNNAFANASSSLLQAKMNGLTGDFLTPPLTPMEHVAGFALGAATRGIVVGAVTWLAVLPFAHLPVTHLWAILYFGAGASMILGLLGVMAGLWSEKFDHMSAVTNFIIMPMTFLSGTFYLVERLPEPFRSASHYNPFFYLIDGFRYGFIGHAEGSLLAGMGMTAGLVIAFSCICLWMFETGYKLKT
ncbi:ABC transporter permease [Phenylobacterium sp.]|uniref:ABC transporter permease n=1 Tax=Phenylobacterium sp. TaxID=1871053 RepID=UPI0030F36FDC